MSQTKKNGGKKRPGPCGGSSSRTLGSVAARHASIHIAVAVAWNVRLERGKRQRRATSLRSPPLNIAG